MSMRKSGLFSTPFGMNSQQHFLAVLNDIAILFPVFLLIFTWRGFCQALAAKYMGDKTAEDIHRLISSSKLRYIHKCGHFPQA